MKLKKVRRICMVKGCRNVDCYTLTASREFGQSVIMCASCIKAAAAELERLEKLAQDGATGATLPTDEGEAEQPLRQPAAAAVRVKPKQVSGRYRMGAVSQIADLDSTPTSLKREASDGGKKKSTAKKGGKSK